MSTSENKQDKIADDFFGGDRVLQTCGIPNCPNKATHLVWAKPTEDWQGFVYVCEEHYNEIDRVTIRQPIPRQKNPNVPRFFMRHKGVCYWLVSSRPYIKTDLPEFLGQAEPDWHCLVANKLAAQKKEPGVTHLGYMV